MRKNKLIVILGQTSTGKSDFAVKVAKQIDGLNQSKRLVAQTSRSEVLGEIISADSRQVYKGMNLGTGKVPRDKQSPKTKKQKPKTYLYKGVAHHLLDVVSPTKTFSVSDFQRLANKKIEEIIKRGKVPIICGGTGFYIEAITNGTIFPEVPPNKKLREKLYSKSAIVLFEYLEKLDPTRAKAIDKNNKVRLIRAIEIAKALGKVPQLNNNIQSNPNATNSAMAEFVAFGQSSKIDVLKIGLTLPPEIIKEKIRSRLFVRIREGMIKEVENLHKNGVSWKRMYELGLEYRYVSEYLKDKSTRLSPRLQRAKKEKMIEELNTAIWHYAKRQKTWFKRDPNIIWIDPRKKSSETKVLKEIKEFLK